MKKLLIIVLALLIFAMAAGPASAWTRHGYYPRGHSNFGIFIGPPVFFVPPPPVYPRYYAPPYYYPGYRVWVPGYWDYRGDTPYGWERVWIPGHWEWR